MFCGEGVWVEFVIDVIFDVVVCCFVDWFVGVWFDVFISNVGVVELGEFGWFDFVVFCCEYEVNVFGLLWVV